MKYILLIINKAEQVGLDVNIMKTETMTNQAKSENLTIFNTSSLKNHIKHQMARQDIKQNKTSKCKPFKKTT